MDLTHTHTNKADNNIFSHICDNIGNYKGQNFDDLHHLLFNEDYFIIGYYQAEQFIKENDLNTLDLITYCQEMEKENFGEIQTTFDNAEKIVNHYAYWRGQELLFEIKSLQDYQETWTIKNTDLMISGQLIKDIKEELNLCYDLGNSFKSDEFGKEYFISK